MDSFIASAARALAAGDPLGALKRVALRAALRPLARVEATSRGFRLTPIEAPAVVVLAPPIDGPAGSIVALLESGESWSTSVLACALGSGQRWADSRQHCYSQVRWRWVRVGS